MNLRPSLALVLLLAAACGESSKPAPAANGVAPTGAAPSRPVTIQHVVLIKLKDPARAAELIRDTRAMAAEIPQVVSAHAGGPLDLGRPNVDKGYDVAFVASFEDQAGYLAYLVHPAHEEVGRKWKEQMEWMRVHDVTEGAR